MPESGTLMAVSLQSTQDVASDYATLAFVIQQIIAGLATATLVKVIACTNTGELERAGRVDVQILVGQVTGDGQVIRHGVTYNLPFHRLQGGSNAVILDPQPGDIGLAVFCMRDISAVKKDPAKAVADGPAALTVYPPGSANQYNFSNGVYVGGFLNPAPVAQYVRFTSAGLTVFSDTKITLQAPVIELKGDVAQTDGDITASGSVTAQGDVVGEGISLHDHVHPKGSGPNTEPPI